MVKLITTLRPSDVKEHTEQPQGCSQYSDKDREMVAEFDVSMLMPIGMTIVVFGIAISYGLQVMDDVQDDMAECNATHPYDEDAQLCINATGGDAWAPTASAGFNATTNGISAVAEFPERLGLIVTVIIAAVVIGILVRYLFVRYA